VLPPLGDEGVITGGGVYVADGAGADGLFCVFEDCEGEASGLAIVILPEPPQFEQLTFPMLPHV
jgi:hypothetical protein